ncbi:MAG: Bax inhibitor-1/YccA family protein [Frankia sp.]
MAELRSSNPVFRRGGFGAPAEPTGAPDPLDNLYHDPGRLTIDDVVIHTFGVFAVTAAAGAIGWAIAPGMPGVGFAAGLGALALSLFIAFRNALRPPLIVLFAVLEGLFVGAISRYYEDAYHGIVLQALLGTGLVFVTMLGAYRLRILRATPRMARVVFGTLMGVVALGLIDLVVRVTTGSQLPVINSGSTFGILFSVVVLAVASLQFILDFDYIERAIAAGAPRSDAWRAAYGLLIGFVWVYLELLRLLGKLRQ